MLEDGTIERFRDGRYDGWNGDLGRRILAGEVDLATLADDAVNADLDPKPVSGRQEWLENAVNRILWSTPN